jgi:Predicted dehydrogenases and related proteins
MNNKMKYGFGVIGCGMISNAHCMAIKDIDGAQLLAVCDISRMSAEGRAKEYGVDWYTDYKQLIGRDDIDIVCVCTPSGLRHDIAIEAAKYGKHIIAEKPIEIGLNRIDDMINTAKQHNVKLAGIFNLRYKKIYEAAKKAVSSERFGKPVLGCVSVKWYRDQKYYDSAQWRGTWLLDGGGVLMNQSIHYIDLLQWIMGPVEMVYGICSTLGHKSIEVEDTAAALLKFKNGAQGIIEATTSAYPGISSRIELHGESGSIMTVNDNMEFWKFKDEDPMDDEVRKLKTKNSANTFSDPLSIDYTLHKRQIEDILNAIDSDTEPSVNGNEARKAVEIVQAIYKSSKENRPIYLPL